ncbi:MAG TPA: DUF1326 domain-containing protein [Pyrinomonadaceae bacterium]|nr:DUF1326 domain-containing protein [Pyrinomonadaceae bacterium]
MRRFLIPSVVGLALVLTCGAALVSSRAAGEGVRGTYVEARTASVFAGACHYNGELTTAGREAVLAWNVKEGSWGGVDLAGVRALAVVGSEANLSDSAAARRSELVVDSNASAEQARAFARAVERAYGAVLGRVVEVRRAPVGFVADGKSFKVSAAGAATLDVEAMPDDLCCRMPHMVWYAPLVAVEGRKVGYTRAASYAGGAAGDAWQRTGENGAFYGTFSF